MVRATSPGAEFREAQRVAAARKEAEEKHKRAVYSGPSPFSEPHPSSATGPEVSGPSAAGYTPASAETYSNRAQALRRFQISRSNLASLSGPGGGVQKRRVGGPAPGVAVLVEQLQRNAHSRKASMVSDLVAGAQALSIKPKELVQDTPPSPVKPRKRPVVNQAEKRWREERKTAISAAKQHLSETMEKSTESQQRNWDESERLAREFEQVALELEREGEQHRGMDLDVRVAGNPPPQPAPFQHAFSTAPKTPLKHQPRPPKEPRVAPAVTQSSEKNEQAVEEDDDGDYVYDVYIRRPLSETEMLKNPLAEYESDQQQKEMTKSQPGVGVIIITAEDEEYWEHFVEDDEEEWDSEDADSNGMSNVPFRLTLPLPFVHEPLLTVNPQLKTIPPMITRTKRCHLTTSSTLMTRRARMVGLDICRAGVDTWTLTRTIDFSFSSGLFGVWYLAISIGTWCAMPHMAFLAEILLQGLKRPICPSPGSSYFIFLCLLS